MFQSKLFKNQYKINFRLKIKNLLNSLIIADLQETFQRTFKGYFYVLRMFARTSLE